MDKEDTTRGCWDHSYTLPALPSRVACARTLAEEDKDDRGDNHQEGEDIRSMGDSRVGDQRDRGHQLSLDVLRTPTSVREDRTATGNWDQQQGPSLGGRLLQIPEAPGCVLRGDRALTEPKKKKKKQQHPRHAMTAHARRHLCCLFAWSAFSHG